MDKNKPDRVNPELAIMSSSDGEIEDNINEHFCRSRLVCPSPQSLGDLRIEEALYWPVAGGRQ